MKKFVYLASAVGALALAMPAQAAPIFAPVPAANYITVGGLDWAWAGPCAATGGCGDIDLSYQSTQGWRQPTLQEFINRPLPGDFGTKCASPWFNTVHSHCDFGDAANGFIWKWGYPAAQVGIDDFHGDHPLSETWVVRNAVPEPAAWGMMLLGFGLAGTAMRRRTKVSVSFA